MSVVVVTGSCGLIGSESVSHFADQGCDIIGIDNDLRRVFFGNQSSTAWIRETLERRYRRYQHFSLDIRDRNGLEQVFARVGRDIALVIHTAAQPSHDWAAQDPYTDFSVNATGTLMLLECTRQHCPEAVFVFTSTNKVYGDTPNRLPLVELESRWELDPSHAMYRGVTEAMSIDASTHSLFGVSKTSADLLVQEYGRYFGMKTACFRAGCMTGPNHSGAMLHGFLAYLLRCVAMQTPYTIFGYKGKQVRDHIHSADFLNAVDAFFKDPRAGEVYNLGGGRECNCSVIEAIDLCEETTGLRLASSYDDRARVGDHAWYITNLDKFRSHYPDWRLQYGLRDLVTEIYDRNLSRWQSIGELQ
jgi:CDP-paratose 2-epimerase